MKNTCRLVLRWFGMIPIIPFFFLACQPENETPQPPNILWLYVEDISPNLGCYGETTVRTPNIDLLAQNGLRFTHAFMPSAVCSPTRSAGNYYRGNANYIGHAQPS